LTSPARATCTPAPARGIPPTIRSARSRSHRPPSHDPAAAV